LAAVDPIRYSAKTSLFRRFDALKVRGIIKFEDLIEGKIMFSAFDPFFFLDSFTGDISRHLPPNKEIYRNLS